jgi:hypothetical protein
MKLFNNTRDDLHLYFKRLVMTKLYIVVALF